MSYRTTIDANQKGINLKLKELLDFRDLWNNRIVHKKYQSNLTESLQDFFTRLYWNKWHSKAEFFSIASKNWLDKIYEFSNLHGLVIHNGFKNELSENVYTHLKQNEFFILISGSQYEHQRIDILLKGCKNSYIKSKLII